VGSAVARLKEFSLLKDENVSPSHAGEMVRGTAAGDPGTYYDQLCMLDQKPAVSPKLLY
jgi:hypothetical protein